MHPHRVVDPERAEHLVQHRHEDAAAADPEQPGEQPGHEPGREQRAREAQDLAKGMPISIAVADRRISQPSVPPAVQDRA